MFKTLALVHTHAVKHTLANISGAPKLPSCRSLLTSAPDILQPIAPQPKIPHLVNMADLSKHEIYSILGTALDLKRKSKSGLELGSPLKDKSLALIFTKRSTRTRLAAETAMDMLGGNAIFVSPQDIQLGVNESNKDSALVISRLVDGIFLRTDSHDDILEFKQFSIVPIINGLCDLHHPTQAFADALTIYESLNHDASSIGTKKLTYVGDGNNVCHSLYTMLIKLGMSVSIAAPKGFEPNSNIVDPAHVFNDPRTALSKADFVYTDTFISMGQQELDAPDLKLAKFKDFKITRGLLESGHVDPNYKFLHCLPRKQYEVDDEVFYGDHSLVWDQAENRKWTMMSIFLHTLLK